VTAAGRSLVVVGGGIAGLAAAWEAAVSGATDVTVLEATDRLGGRIRTSAVDGLAVDEGADAFLARVPWALDLCRELGLDDELVSPVTGNAYVYSRGGLRPLPATHVLGVPLDLDELADGGIVSAAGVAEARRCIEAAGPEVGDDTIGVVLRRQVGAEVTARLVDPLVGGINAGDTERLSLRAVVPQLAEAAEHRDGLVAGLRALRASHPPDPAAPVFAGLPGGTERLVTVLGARLVDAGATVRTDSPVRALAGPAGGGHRLSVGASGDETITADRVVLATPAPVTAGLIAPGAPGAATALESVEHASVALVTLVVDAADTGRALDGSGFLVPRAEGLDVTACSWASSKWAHLRTDDRVVLRASVGRAGSAGALEGDDDGLVELVRRDLATTMGLEGEPRAARVSRWPRSFPQYAPGHLDLVDRIEAELADRLTGVAVAGWTYRGIGIPACIRTGREATRRLLA
jgi:oxygen-dependent protoporphyrinogen oxidase